MKNEEIKIGENPTIDLNRGIIGEKFKITKEKLDNNKKH